MLRVNGTAWLVVVAFYCLGYQMVYCFLFSEQAEMLVVPTSSSGANIIVLDIVTGFISIECGSQLHQYHASKPELK